MPTVETTNFGLTYGNEVVVDLSSQPQNIQWNILPGSAKAGFLETRKERRIAAIAAAAFAMLAGVCTFGAATSFTAAPLVVIGVTFGLAFLTLAAITTAIGLLLLKQSKNDPEVKLALRQQLKKDLELGIPSFGAIRDKYTTDVVSDSEVNIILAKDLLALNYPAFKKKHGELAINILNEENKAKLRSKCLEHFQSNLSFKEIAKQPEVQEFGIQKNEWAAYVALREANRVMLLKGTTYDEFIARNGIEAITYLNTHELAFTHLKESFQQSILNRNLGVKDFNATPCPKEFDAVFINQLRQKIILNELKKLETKSQSYLEFVNRNGGLDIVKEVMQNDYKEVLRAAFLRLPYATQKSLEQHKQLLQISEDAILGPLIQKWNGLNIQAVVEDQDFQQALRDGAISPDLFTVRALEETNHLSVIEIARQMPLLFSGGILKSNSLSEQGTIFERLDNEVNALKNIGELLTLPAVLFQSNIINRSNEVIVNLVKAFVQTHAASYLENQWHGNELNIRNKIDQYQLLPSSITNELAIAQQAYNEQKVIHQQHLKKFEVTFSSNLHQLEQVRTDRKQEVAKHAGLSEWEKQVSIAQDRVHQTTQELGQAERKLEAAKNEFSNVASNIAKLNTQARNLSQQVRELESKNLEHGLNRYTELLQSKEQLLNQHKIGIGNNSELIELSTKISELKKNISTVECSQRQVSAQLTELQSFQAKVERLEVLKLEMAKPEFLQREVELELRIKDAESSRAKPTGLANALKARKKDPDLEADRKSLAAMQAMKVEFETLTVAIHSDKKSGNIPKQIEDLTIQLEQINSSINQNNFSLRNFQEARVALRTRLENSSTISQLEKERNAFAENVQTYKNSIAELQRLRGTPAEINASLTNFQNSLRSARLNLEAVTSDYNRKNSVRQSEEANLQTVSSSLTKMRTYVNDENSVIDADFSQRKAHFKQQLDDQISQVTALLQSNQARIIQALVNNLN